MSPRGADWFVRLLPLDSCGRRAVDEVLADWRHEVRAAPRTLAQLLAHARGAAALASTVLLIGVREMKCVPASRATWMTLLWLAASFIVVSLPIVQMNLRLATAAADLPMVLARTWLTCLMFFLPPALFAGVHSAARREPDVPYAGLALGAFVLMAVTAFLLYPQLVANMGVAVLRRPGTTLELPESTWARQMIDQLRLSLVLVSPLLVLLAARLQAIGQWRSRLAPVAVTAAYLALLVLSLSGRPYRLARLPAGYLTPLIPWLMPALALIAIAGASRARGGSALAKDPAS